MGKKQKIIFDAFRGNRKLSSIFYFTGGTALSEFYLKHRESLDLDFFTQNEFDSQIILEAVQSWSKKYRFIIKSSFIDPTYIYILNFKDGEQLKIDFARYPYPQLNKPKSHDGILVDSFLDLAANKLLLINQRTEVKDFVDLYFILKKFNFWELRDAVKTKFNVEIEPFLAAADFMKVADFEIMPKMYKKLDLETLKKFFQTQAKNLGSQFT